MRSLRRQPLAGGPAPADGGVVDGHDISSEGMSGGPHGEAWPGGTAAGADRGARRPLAPRGMRALTGPTARIVLVDEHALCRHALTDLIGRCSAMQVVAATGDPDQALPLLLAHRPDLLIMEMQLPGADGLAVLARLRAAGADTPTVLFTTRDAQGDLGAALRAGVQGYLLKTMDPQDVVAAIGRAARGELVLAPGLARHAAAPPAAGIGRHLLFASLTRRERQILEHLARGETNKAIGRALAISHDTVKLHVRHILAKLKLGSRVEAAVFAVEQRG